MFHIEKITVNEVDIHLLHYTDFNVADYLSSLLPDEVTQLETYTSTSRQKEYLATRYLRTQLMGKTPIHYSEIGAPYLNDGDFISIAHTKAVVGIARCKSFPIGFDLEPIHEKVVRVKHKFLHPSEITHFDTTNTAELIKIWSAKEALYKCSSKNGLHFSRDLKLEKITETHWNGTVYDGLTEKNVSLTVLQRENLIVTVTTSPLIAIN